MGQRAEATKIKINHAISETHVVLQFSIPIENLCLTPAEAKAFVACVQNSIQKFEERQTATASGKPN